MQSMNYIMQQFHGSEINTSFDSNIITVNVPNSIAEKWTTTDQVGIENRIKINSEEDLFILL